MEKIQITSRGFNDCIDLTRRIQIAVSNLGYRDCAVRIFAPSACAVLVLPKGGAILGDLIGILEHVVPINKNYKFDEKNTNAHAYLRSLLIGRSVTVAVVDGKLDLTEEQIALIDFDNKAQTRVVKVQVAG